METGIRPTEDLPYEDLLYRYQEERIKSQRLAKECLELKIENRELKSNSTRVHNQHENMKDKLLACESRFQMIANVENYTFITYRLNKPSNDGIVCLIDHMKEEAVQGLTIINEKMKRRRL